MPCNAIRTGNNNLMKERTIIPENKMSHIISGVMSLLFADIKPIFLKLMNFRFAATVPIYSFQRTRLFALRWKSFVGPWMVKARAPLCLYRTSGSQDQEVHDLLLYLRTQTLQRKIRCRTGMLPI